MTPDASAAEPVWSRLHFADGHQQYVRVEFRYFLHWKDASPLDTRALTQETQDARFLQTCGILPPLPDCILGTIRRFTFQYWDSGVAVYLEMS